MSIHRSLRSAHVWLCCASVEMAGVELFFIDASPVHYTVNPPLYISENARDIYLNKAFNSRLLQFVGYQYEIMK